MEGSKPRDRSHRTTPAGLDSTDKGPDKTPASPDSTVAGLDNTLLDDSQPGSLLDDSQPRAARLPKRLPEFSQSKVGDYVLGRVIGSGGMGVIYAATDTKLRRT